MAGGAATRSRAHRSWSTWATATAGRASTATRSTRRPRTGSASTRSSARGDSAHQYFGEGIVGSQVKLARNAVVLLNHLCYASGLSEPGLPEGTLDQARQRVDNYAAGFVRAGASAVIAEAYQSPSYFVKAILGGGRSIQSAWQSSPSANGHRVAFESQRNAGYIAQMDTETATTGFSRSIVMKAGLAPKDVLAGAAGSAFAASIPNADFGPTLAGTGIPLGSPNFAALPSAGSATTLDVPYTIKNRKALPKGLEASVRWDPIDVAFAPVAPADEVAAPAGAAPADTDPRHAPCQGADRRHHTVRRRPRGRPSARRRPAARCTGRRLRPGRCGARR